MTQNGLKHIFNIFLKSVTKTNFEGFPKCDRSDSVSCCNPLKRESKSLAPSS